MTVDWFAYAKKTTKRFVERFADLDPGEHPDKAPGIAEARRLRAIYDGMKSYNEVVDEMLEAARRTEERFRAFADESDNASEALAAFRRGATGEG